jgi:hypothetical protein
VRDIYNNHGATLLNLYLAYQYNIPNCRRYYGGSLQKALKALYPQVKWDSWKFKKASNAFWKSDDNVKEYLKSISEHLGITDLRDWHSISRNYLSATGGTNAMKRYGGLIPMLSTFYPGHNWKSEPTRTYPSKAQILLFKTMQQLFQDVEVKFDYQSPDLYYKKTGRELQLDVSLHLY